MGVLAGFDHLRNVDAVPEDLHMLHNLLGVVLRQSNTKLGEHTHVSTLKTKACFKKRDKLLKVTFALVLLDKIVELFSVDNEVETAYLGKSEFLLDQASLMYLLPNFHTVGTASTLNSLLILFKMNQGGSKFGPVRDAGEEDLCCLMITFLVGLVTRSFNISNIGRSQEVLKLWQLIKTSIAECKCSINCWFTLRLAGHLEEFDKIFILSSMGGSLNDFVVVAGILSLDVRFNRVRHTETIKLCLGNLAPDLRQVNTLGILLSTIDADNMINKYVCSG